MADLTKVADNDILQEMKRRYEIGAAELEKIKQEYDAKAASLKGYKLMLQEAGLLEKPVVGKRGRKPKAETA
jgi:hypothetical protein